MNNDNTVTTIPQSPAESKARDLLKFAGYDCLQQLDWLGRKDNQYTVFEVKERELYYPDQDFPHWGTGLDLSQLWLRSQILKHLKLRTYLLVFEKDTDNVYGEYLDVLENRGGYYDTPKKIRIYPIDHFTKLTTIKISPVASS
jgi:hypothetical protein